MNKDTSTTGWEQHNRGHFDDITEKYDQVRQRHKEGNTKARQPDYTHQL